MFIPFFYKDYEYSGPATLTSIVFRCLCLFSAFGGLFLFSVSQIVLGILCLVLAVGLFFLGNKLSDAIAAKAYEKLVIREQEKLSNLIPVRDIMVEENGQMVHRQVQDLPEGTLNPPATITICRNPALGYNRIPIEFHLNNQPFCTLKGKQDACITTTQALNTITSKQCDPLTIGVRPGENVVVHYEGFIFKGLARI